MDHSPLVTVIVPAYNAATYVARTLESVLDQTYRNLEVLVVDDGSTDDTPEILRRIASSDSRIRILRQRNAGVAAARNHAIANSRGEFVAPVDADDLWFPRKIEMQVKEMLEGGEDVGLVYCWWVGVDENDLVTGAAAKWSALGDLANAHVFINFVGNASVPLFRRSALDAVGGYNERFRQNGGQGCEDWDLSLRIAERYEFRVARAFLAGYRKVYGSMSENWEAMVRSFELMIADLRERRPDVNPLYVTWSRSHFYFYIAVIAYANVEPRAALRWLGRAARIDPAMLLPIGILKISLKCLVRIALLPITSRIWPDVASWRAFRKKIRLRRPDKYTLAEFEIDSWRARPTWGWRGWKPHDRVMQSRWRRLRDAPTTSRTSTPANAA